MTKFVNPFTDKGFKIVFGQEICKPLLVEFLNDLLEGERKIEDISFMDKEMMPETLNGRVVIFDILCKDQDGTYFIVEMQNRMQDYFIERGLYYLCRMISQQGERGNAWKYDFCPVYGVYFLNFTIPPITKFRTNVILADEATGKLFSGKMKQIYLSLPLFTLACEECVTDFQRWIYLLKYMDVLDRMPFKAQKAVFEKLLDVADLSRLDPKERAQYDATLKAYRDWSNCVRCEVRMAEEKGLKMGMEKGLQKGLEQGIQQGIEQGIEKGIEQGMQQGIQQGIQQGMEKGLLEAKRIIAAHLKKQGLDRQCILEATGLSPEEIDSL